MDRQSGFYMQKKRFRDLQDRTKDMDMEKAKKTNQMKRCLYISKDSHIEFKLMCKKKYIPMYNMADKIIADWVFKEKMKEKEELTEDW